MRMPVEQVGQVGVVQDVPPRLLPANAWTNGRNISTYAGAIGSVKGWKSVIKTPTNSPFWLLPWLVDGAQQWIYAGWDGSKMVLSRITNSTTEADISSGTYTGTRSDRWTGGVLGGLPFANNGTDEPQVWDGSAFQDMNNITGWTSGDTARVMRAFRSFLVVGDITESGTRNRTLLRWSHPADPGTLPSTWDSTDTTKLSGRTELSDSDDPIVDFVPLGEDLLIYRTKSVWRMTFLEHSILVFDIAPVFTSFGAAAVDCAADTGDGRHVVFTGTDIIEHDGRQAKSILSKRMKQRLPSLMDVTARDRSFMAVDRVRSEILFCYPAQGQPTATEGFSVPQKAITYAWETGDFGKRDIPPSTIACSGDLQDYEGDGEWDDDTQAWDDDLSTWDEVDRQGRSNLILVGAENDKFYGLNLTYAHAGSDFVSTLERKDLPIEGKDPDELVLITGLYPKIKIAGDYEIDVYVGGRLLEEDSISWSGPHRFNPASDKKIDCLVHGRWISIRFSFRGQGGYRMSGYTVLWEHAGWH